MLDWILMRLKEPSTWAGFAGLFAAAGISDVLYVEISAAGAAIAGLIAALLHEQKPSE